MKLTKNEELYTLNDKIKDLDPSTLTTLAQTDADALDVFSSRMTGVFDGASDDAWHDKVRTAITTGISHLKEYIEEEKKSAEFIKGAVGPITNMKTIVAKYVEEFDKYAAIADNAPTKYEQEDGKDKVYDDGHKRVSSDYISWSRQVEAYEKAIPTLEEEAERLIQAVKNYFAAIDLTTHTMDSSVYAAGDGDIKIKYEEILRQISEIPDDEYVKKHDTEFTTDDQGHIVSKDVYEVHKEFEDGSKYDGERTVEKTYGDINGDGKVDETDELIYTKVHEEGEYTDPEGHKYGYLHDEESDQIGIVSSHTVLTDEETGEVAREEEMERTAAYTDITGSDTTEVNETVNDGETTTETRTTTVSAGDQEFKEEVVIETNNDAPETGTVKTADDRTVTVYRDPETGKLMSQETWTDKNGKEVKETPTEVKEETRTVTITYPDGKTEKMTVNPNNPIDEQRIFNKLEDARSQYYTSGSQPTGLRYMDLVQDGETSISDPWSDEQITITME